MNTNQDRLDEILDGLRPIAWVGELAYSAHIPDKRLAKAKESIQALINQSNIELLEELIDWYNTTDENAEYGGTVHNKLETELIKLRANTPEEK